MFFWGTCLDSVAPTLADHQKSSDKYSPSSPRVRASGECGEDSGEGGVFAQRSAPLSSV